MKKKAVETVENKKHISHRFHSTAATTATVIYFLKMCNLRVTILMKTFLSLVKESNGFFKRNCRKLLTQLGNRSPAEVYWN